jgi:uncharacterized repeat protein (TIGR01451 family)
VQIDVETSGIISNTASVVSDTNDPNTANNQTTEDTTVNTPPDSPPMIDADLSITKVDSADPIMAGSQLTYTITVNNAGPATATNVQVTDTLPVDVSFVSTTGCNDDPIGVPDCSLGDIASGGSKQYTVVVDINQTSIGSISNSANVTSNTTDPDSSNNITSELTEVAEFGDITLGGCIGRDDIIVLLKALRARNPDPAWDFNGDGKISRADGRAIVGLFTNPHGFCP